jgi:hypothetical protein
MAAPDNSPFALGRRLYLKWRRDDSLGLAARMEKAAAYALDLARAKVYLRQADEVALDVRVIGRPRVRNEGGRLVIGERTVVRSIVAPVEITVGRGATMVIGRSVHLNSGGTFAAYGRVEIGDRAEISPFVTIYTPRSMISTRGTSAPIRGR